MAAPFLDFFMSDLVHQVQPLSLFLNGVTALFSLFGFAMSGPVVWRPAILLTIVTTATAPLVAWLAQHVAVTSPSFSARIPHIASARVEPSVGR